VTHPASETRASSSAAAPGDPAAVCSALRQRFAAELAQREQQSARLSLLRLVSFIGSAVLLTFAITDDLGWAYAGAACGAALFAIAIGVQTRVLLLGEGARVRRDVHERHLMRLSSAWTELPNRGEALLPQTHAYAWDIDVVGPGSLFQRIDVTHTVHGERALADWLGRPANPDVIRARQQAVTELAAQIDLRQELEAAALLASGGEKLDGRPFRQFAELPSLFERHVWLGAAICALPVMTLLAYLLLPVGLWLVPLGAQVALLVATGRATKEAFDLAAARQGVAEAFERMLALVERASWQSPLLRELQARLRVEGTSPSAHMRSLKSWTSLIELRRQFLIYVFVNPLTLWDLHVLWGLSRWNARVGRRTADWFAALGELEALCSLATLAFCEPEARMPEIGAPGAAFSAEKLGHPLIVSDVRIDNDLRIAGPGCALIVTGSNMAGKSTLLRAVGINAVLALAGGPVCAASLRLPVVRLRASVRTQDSLQQGASYFHAELQKLRAVVDDAAAQPPILFLLDELLRGTNAHARHIGARAVLLHLIERGALGMVATHDVALSALEQEYPGRVGNVHFTDVVADGEMRFDYRLREGVVKTSNALRLLALAGIDVPDDDSVGEPREQSAREPRAERP
jgi:hypothetical protein